jgi:hypothetical protein
MERQCTAGRARPAGARCPVRLERIERLLVPRAAVPNFWLRRVFYLFRLGIYGNASPGNQTTSPLSNQRPARQPKIHQVEPEVCSLFCPGCQHPSAAVVPFCFAERLPMPLKRLTGGLGAGGAEWGKRTFAPDFCASDVIVLATLAPRCVILGYR